MWWAALGARRVAEAFTFAITAIAYIRVRPFWWSWSLLIPLAFAVGPGYWPTQRHLLPT